MLFSSMSSSSNFFPQNHFKKVVWLVFENTSYKKALAQEDFKKLTDKGALFTNLRADTHPSQGNYIAMIAGSTLGVKGDGNVDLKENHIGDLLEKIGSSWKVYAEDYPGNCFKGKSAQGYFRKHVPFMSFLNVSQNSSRCLNIEDEKNFLHDFNMNSLPEFSMYIPNITNDGHDTNVDFAGKWMSRKFGHIFNEPSSMGDVLFIITFDESTFLSLDNQVYTVFLGANILPGVQNAQKLKHTAILKMIEDEFGTGNLNRDDKNAPEILGIWKF